jgi:hypothetical protein
MRSQDGWPKQAKGSVSLPSCTAKAAQLTSGGPSNQLVPVSRGTGINGI